MNEARVWLITGAGRGMGVDIARAALAAGDRVVATARDAANVVAAVGERDDLLAVSLDITDTASIDAAVGAAMDRFGRIDVLVNNAGSFQAGYFEEISPEQFRAQMETNFFGPLNVTRAVLPVMRRQRSGHVVMITSTAGIVSGGFGSAYGASKFALEGWTESLREEVEQFGMKSRSLNPASSAPNCSSRVVHPLAGPVDRRLRRHGEHHRGLAIDEREAERGFREARREPRQDDPARRGARALGGRRRRGEGVKKKGQTLIDQAEAHLELSTGLDHADSPA